MCGNNNLKDLIIKNRSYRKFNHETIISDETLRELVGFARLTASAGNLQPLKYILSSNEKTNELIFPNLAWAGYLTDWAGPEDGEKPSGYIIILGDTEISKSFGCDSGIATQSILLASTEMGLGGCIIASIKQQELRAALEIDTRYEIIVVLAIGEPAEEVTIETVQDENDIKYWRDDKSVHHVPKRSLDSLIIKK